MRVELDISAEVKNGNLTVQTSVRQGRRVDILYEITDPNTTLRCGNGCNKPAKFVVFMRTHKGNESISTDCEEHSRWFRNYISQP